MYEQAIKFIEGVSRRELQCVVLKRLYTGH